MMTAHDPMEVSEQSPAGGAVPAAGAVIEDRREWVLPVMGVLCLTMAVWMLWGVFDWPRSASAESLFMAVIGVTFACLGAALCLQPLGRLPVVGPVASWVARGLMWPVGVVYVVSLVFTYVTAPLMALLTFVSVPVSAWVTARVLGLLGDDVVRAGVYATLVTESFLLIHFGEKVMRKLIEVFTEKHGFRYGGLYRVLGTSYMRGYVYTALGLTYLITNAEHLSGLQIITGATWAALRDVMQQVLVTVIAFDRASSFFGEARRQARTIAQ
jgi:hypothetical protein